MVLIVVIALLDEFVKPRLFPKRFGVVIEDSLLQIVISEFEYNLSQQVYVSDSLWELIETSKNKTIQLILSVKINLKKNANGQDFYNSLENVLNNQNVTPSKITLNYLKKEFRSI